MIRFSVNLIHKKTTLLICKFYDSILQSIITTRQTSCSPSISYWNVHASLIQYYLDTHELRAILFAKFSSNIQQSSSNWRVRIILKTLLIDQRNYFRCEWDDGLVTLIYHNATTALLFPSLKQKISIVITDFELVFSLAILFKN